MTPGWAPDGRAPDATKLLAYALIERTIEVPLSALHEASASHDGQSILLRLLMEDADQALDLLRFDLCRFSRLHYLPAKPGWLGEFALAWVEPEGPGSRARLLAGKPYVLRVSNTWLGLEVDAGFHAMGIALAEIITDNTDEDEVTLALKGALRAWNRSLYLVELEASFLHLIYAVDALCAPGQLKGTRHRLWITAYASRGSAEDFGERFDEFSRHYEIRNQIVHEGASFASLGLEGEAHCDFMLGILRACLMTFVREGFASFEEASQFAFARLVSADLSAITAAGKIAVPLTTDKPFARHMNL